MSYIDEINAIGYDTTSDGDVTTCLLRHACSEVDRLRIKLEKMETIEKQRDHLRVMIAEAQELVKKKLVTPGDALSLLQKEIYKG
jgi:hypothetical protein